MLWVTNCYVWTVFTEELSYSSWIFSTRLGELRNPNCQSYPLNCKYLIMATCVILSVGLMQSLWFLCCNNSAYVPWPWLANGLITLIPSLNLIEISQYNVCCFLLCLIEMSFFNSVKFEHTVSYWRPDWVCGKFVLRSGRKIKATLKPSGSCC